MTDTGSPIAATREEYFGHERLVFDAGDGQIVKLIWVLPGVWSFAHLRAVRQTGEQPGFIPVLVADTATDGRPFLVHERVNAGGFWEWDQATADSDDQIQILWQAAKALAEAHLRGVYHGAFYPGSIVILDDDVALAEVGYGMGGQPPSDLLEWVAPEFQTNYGMSAAADVWSLGRMLNRVPDLPPAIGAVAAQAALTGPSARPSAADIAEVIQDHYGPDFEGDYGLAFLTGTASADLGDIAIQVLEDQEQPPDPDPDPDPEPEPDPRPATVADVLTNQPTTSMLVELLGLASTVGPLNFVGLTEDPDAEFTLLAPTNTAITALGQTVLDEAIADPEGRLTDLLREHVVLDTAITIDDMVGAGEITTLSGRTHPVRVIDGQVMIGDNTPMVITGDLDADNGVVHIIDEVILPVPPMPPDPEGPTIWSIVEEDARFGTLQGALAAASTVGDTDFVGVVSDRDVELTVFAPTNSGFLALGSGLDDALADPGGVLSRILDNHVVAGRVTRSDLLSVREIETIGGGRVTIRTRGDELFVNDAHIEEADVEADNGLVHVIDRVLLPDSILPPDPPPVDPPTPPVIPPAGFDRWAEVIAGVLAAIAALILLLWLVARDPDTDPDPDPDLTTTTETTIGTTTSDPDPPTTGTLVPPSTTSTTDPDHGDPPVTVAGTLGVEIVHGIEDLDLDFRIDGDPAAAGVEPYNIAGPIQFESGIYGIEVVDDDGEVIAEGAFEIQDKPVTVVVFADADGNVKITSFEDPTGETAAAHGLVIVRHLDPPDDLVVAVGNGDDRVIPLGDEHQFEVDAGRPVVRLGIDIQQVDLAEGERLILTTVEDGVVLAQRHDGDAGIPDGIPAGNSGLRAAQNAADAAGVPLPALIAALAILASCGGLAGARAQEAIRSRRA